MLPSQPCPRAEPLPRIHQFYILRIGLYAHYTNVFSLPKVIFKRKKIAPPPLCGNGDTEKGQLGSHDKRKSEIAKCNLSNSGNL